MNFNLENNTVKEFDKTKRIQEVPEQEISPQTPQPSASKSVQQQNMDDLVSRTLKQKKTTEDIAKLGKAEVVTEAVKKSI